MMNKKIVGSVLAGAMAVVSISGVGHSAGEVKVVNAGVREDNLAVHNKIEHIRYSLKKNYLGLKNVGQWQQYIKEARALNAKLPKGSTRDKYTGRINSAESLVNAAARVNQLEFSMDKNAHIMANVPQWEKYFELAVIDLEKVNYDEYGKQVDTLVDRLIIRAEQIYEITGVDEGEGVDINAVVEKDDASKIIVTFSEAVTSEIQDVKDSIAVKVNGKAAVVKSAEIGENGLSISIVLEAPIEAGQAVTLSISEDGTIENKDGYIIYTEEPLEVDNLS